MGKYYIVDMDLTHSSLFGSINMVYLFFSFLISQPEIIMQMGMLCTSQKIHKVLE